MGDCCSSDVRSVDDASVVPEKLPIKDREDESEDESTKVFVMTSISTKYIYMYMHICYNIFFFKFLMII